jgi:steroid 5-alpha reductase family enzyme
MRGGEDVSSLEHGNVNRNNTTIITTNTNTNTTNASIAAAILRRRLEPLLVVGKKIFRVAPIVIIMAIVTSVSISSSSAWISVYGWALMGSIVGFYRFVYFVTIGYALGIGVPVAALLWQYSIQNPQKNAMAMFHSYMVLLWSLRLAGFLWWREYISWPALHAKMIRLQHQQRENISMSQQLICWIVYSFFYVCMLLPCWFRLAYSSSSTQQIPIADTKNIFNMLSGAFQITGLALETIADYQKSKFKEKYRLQWCNMGLWKWSTHPNYAGEWLFWLGTCLGGLPALYELSSSAAAQGKHWQLSILSNWAATFLGLGFVSWIIANATHRLDQKQRLRYSGGDFATDWDRFQMHTSFWGPRKQWQVWRKKSTQSALANSDEEQTSQQLKKTPTDEQALQK